MSGSLDGEQTYGSGLATLTGRQIGRYLVGERLGSGGAATVYRAFDQVQGITVALKVLLPSADEKSLNRFRREALTAGALRHPNIVRILQVGTAPHGEVAYIAMELVEGESLADLLGRRVILPPHESCALLAPIARALAHAHAAGVIHRDVKPSNILLRPAQVGERHAVHLESLDYPVVPLLSDFGIARSLDAPELTSAGRTVGTPAYMAPEQAAGSRTVDGRADIYALATVLYRCVTGRLPYVGSATQILHAHVYEPLLIENAVLAWLPPELPALLARALAKRPEERTQSPQQFAAELESVARLAPPPSEHDPFATATMESQVLSGARPLTSGATQTTVLVPGVVAAAGLVGATAATGSSAPVSPYAPHFGPAGGAPPTPGRSGAYAAAGAGGSNMPPPQPPGVDRELGGTRRWSPWLWVAAIALFVLLGGLTAAIVTAMQRGDPPILASAETITPTLTPTATPTLGPAGLGTPATLVIVLPPEAERTPLPTFVLPPSATPTQLPPFVPPAATQPLEVTATPTPFVVTATPSFTPTPFPTSTPTPPPTVEPSATPSPTFTPQLATATPTVLPTATPTVPATLPPPTATPTPTSQPTATPTEIPSSTPDLTLCTVPVDPALAEFVARLDPITRTGFECPLSPAMAGAAQRLRFERGQMVDGGPLGVLVLVNDGRWEQVLPAWQPGDPDPLPPDLEAPEGTWLPQEIFAAVWMEPGVQEALGYALEPEAAEVPLVAQQFEGGMLAADLTTGEVVALLGENSGL